MRASPVLLLCLGTAARSSWSASLPLPLVEIRSYESHSESALTDLQGCCDSPNEDHLQACLRRVAQISTDDVDTCASDSESTEGGENGEASFALVMMTSAKVTSSYGAWSEAAVAAWALRHGVRFITVEIDDSPEAAAKAGGRGRSPHWWKVSVILTSLLTAGC